MDDIRIIAKELLDELENIKSGDLDSKLRFQGKMKKIISLSDEMILSQDLKDLNKKINCCRDIVNLHSFFLKSPDIKEKGKYFSE